MRGPTLSRDDRKSVTLDKMMCGAFALGIAIGLAAIISISGCAVGASSEPTMPDDVGDVPPELTITPHTGCPFVTDDCSVWLGTDQDRNRLCTSGCGGPAICQMFATTIYLCGSRMGDQCLDFGTHVTLWQATPCNLSAGQCTLETAPGQPTGRCVRSSGTP